MRIAYQNGAHDAGGVESTAVLDEDELEEDGRELGVGKRECPQSEVGGGIRYGAEHEFDGLDHLVDKDVSERVVSVVLALVLNDLSDLLVVIV